MKKYKVVFFGTPDFSVASLKALTEIDNIEIVQVISMPDRPAGRGNKLQSPAVINFAKENDLNFFQTSNINKESSFLEELKSLNIDFFVVIAFAQFLGAKLLNIPRLGAFNIHTSLLPKYRGAAPIQYALLNGDTKTGVTIQKMVKKMDAGDIVYSHEVDIEPNETCDLLFKKLEDQASVGLVKFIESLTTTNEEITYTPQDESCVSFAPTIQKQDGLINPITTSAQEIYNTYRAYFPWPGIYLYTDDSKRLKIIKLTPVDIFVDCAQFSYETGKLLLGTKEGTLHLEVVQLDGKKAVSDKDFINTLKSKKATLNLDRSIYA